MYSLSHIASIVHGTLSGRDVDAVRYICTDSRKLHFPAESLFFAIVTPQRNGHAFIAEAYGQGVRAFVVDRRSHALWAGDDAAAIAATYPDAGFVSVDDTLQALQRLAAHHRSLFGGIPVIGITGSNGKTIVKEWLCQLLQADHHIVRSPKSYNSQIGVPLSVWQMDASHTLAIFEAGISAPGEMAALQHIIRSTIGLLTNIGAAHDEGFEDRRQKLQEKLLLFKEVEVLVCCTDDPLIREMTAALPVRRFTWGRAKENDVHLLKLFKQADGTTIIHLCFNGHDAAIELPFADDASIENAIHCYCIGLLLQLDSAVLIRRMAQLHAVEMRLEWKQAINHCTLLNDSYSNDLSSLGIALDQLRQQGHHAATTVILSDIFQSGISDSMLYFQVAELLRQQGIQRFIGIGPAISSQVQVFRQKVPQVECFPGTEAFMQQFDPLSFSHQAILLKGARSFGFERIARLLELQAHQTVLEIDLTALTHNLRYYRSLLRPDTRIMVMVKAFGYGSGSAEVARVLQFNKVDMLAVAYADEGVELRRAGIHLPVMVMNAEPNTFDLLDEHDLEPEIYSTDMLEGFIRHCEQRGIRSFPVHLKLDTGMHRLGFTMDEVDALARRLATQNTVKLRSVFTHFVASEDPAQDAFTTQQAQQFTQACTVLRQALGYPFIAHAANTAAIRRHPQWQMDMVRLGIGLYGVDPSPQHASSLQVVSTLRSTIAQIKDVKAGETVGYGRKGRVERDARIATVRIGYADGYRRDLGNGIGHMYLHGRLAPVIGNVCMDMTMIDITHIPEAVAGDRVEVFGTHIPVQRLAESCGTIPYEIMTGISQRVKRVYHTE